MARVIVYVDGFNLYYGQCKGRIGRRWLDLGALASRLRPQDEIACIRYFSAWVKGPSQAIRQNVYVRALRTIPVLTDHMSYFSMKPTWMPQVDRSLPDVEVLKTQEKGSDVNLATYLLLDGADGCFEEAVVISNDQDLTLPVQRTRERVGPVHVVAPNNQPGTDLEVAASTYSRLFPSYVRQCQFPDPMTDAAGVFHKPADW